ncbi:MAG: putative cobaltochelatase [Vulcanimicrobiaceae bacterium]
MSVSFPFAAIVGQDDLKDALLRIAVDPAIGGVLVTGTRGTAKSTAVRALADLLPPLEIVPGDAFNRAPARGDQAREIVATPFVELPVGATEDRVIGSLDVRALLAGDRRFEPGLLARANRGILYVDEVNLLPDHLVDVVLDAAATGINVVERDGASFAHDARIVLVGTMNPEEGELRPQLLDRFGLCVAIENDDDIDRRVEIVERRVAFDRDPAAFTACYDRATAAQRERVTRARVLLGDVTVERACLRRAAELALRARAEGMRADLTIVRTARAIAALDGRERVTEDDIERAAPAALAHRRREAAPGAPPPAPPPKNGPSHDGIPRQRESQDKAERNGRSHDAAESDAVSRSRSLQGSASKGSGDTARPERVFDIGTGADLVHDSLHAPSRATSSVRRSVAARGRGSADTTGGISRAVVSATSRISALGTLRAAATARYRASEPTLVIAPEHVRYVQRRGRSPQLVVFLVDASGSMAAAARMRAAKGAVCSLLATAYRRRDAVALVAFRGEDAETLVPPTRSAARAYRKLRTLATGGRTPLGRGLAHAHDLIAAHARREPATDVRLVIVSDARANAPAIGALDSAWHEAARLRLRGVRALCVDTESGRLRLGFAARLANELAAAYRHLDDCTERALGATVREWMATA